MGASDTCRGLNFDSFENGFVAGDMDNTEKKAIEDGKDKNLYEVGRNQFISKF
jgi:hypothetical protein